MKKLNLTVTLFAIIAGILGYTQTGYPTAGVACALGVYALVYSIKFILRASHRKWQTNLFLFKRWFQRTWKALWAVVSDLLLSPLFWTGLMITAAIWAVVWALTGPANLQLEVLCGCLTMIIVTGIRSSVIDTRRQLDEQKKAFDDKIAQADARVGRLNDRETSVAKEVALRATYDALGCPYAYGKIDFSKATVHYLNQLGIVRKMTVAEYRQYRLSTPASDLPAVCLIAITERIKKEGTALDTYGIINHWWLGWHNSDPLWKVISAEGVINLVDSAGKTVELHPLCEEEEAIRKLLTFVSSYSSIANFVLKGIAEYAVPLIARKEGDDGLGIARVALQLREALLAQGCPLSNDFDTTALRIVLQYCKAERDPGRDTPVQ